MRKMTRKILAAGVAERWEKQYYRSRRSYAPNGPRSVTWLNERKRLVHERLVELGDAPDPDAVREIIGNESWTRLVCDNCEQHKDPAVRLRGVGCDEYEETTLCLNCITEAFELLKGDT